MKTIPSACQDRFLPYLTRRQMEMMRDKEKAAIIQPIGSTEQHGPHLPAFTDCIIAQEVLCRALSLVPTDLPVWTLPLLPYGKSNEHAGLAGTITLTSETMIKVLKEIGISIVRNGFRRLVILNAHGGNTEIIDVVIRDLREITDLLVFGLHIGLRVAVPQEGLSESERIYGIHAGDAETSMMLDCAPELVHMEWAVDGTPANLEKLNTHPFLGALNFAWLTKDIAPDGVIGNPKTADAKRGGDYLEGAAREVADLLTQVVEFSF